MTHAQRPTPVGTPLPQGGTLQALSPAVYDSLQKLAHMPKDVIIQVAEVSMSAYDAQTILDCVDAVTRLKKLLDRIS